MNLSVTIIGCGWLGFPLGKKLAQRGYSIYGSVRSENKFDSLLDANIQPFALDLVDSTSISTEIINSTEVLIISIPPLHRDEPVKFQHILSELLDQFSNETRIIFTSSTGIYPQQAGIFDETFEFDPEQESSVLHFAERAIRNSTQQHVIFRLGGLIGPNRHPIRFLQGRKNVSNPNGSINFVHQGDCIRSMIEAIERPEIQGTFNLVYPSYPTRKDYYASAAKYYNLEVPHFDEEESIERVISSEKIIQNLGFQFEYSIHKFPKLNFP